MRYSIAVDFTYFFRKVDACMFLSIDRHPSINSCHPIRVCAITAEDKDTEICVDSSKEFPLHQCNWFKIILTLLVGVSSSNNYSSIKSIDDVYLLFMIVLIHCMTCRLSLGASQKGHISDSIKFSSFIFSSVLQKLDTFFIVQFFDQKRAILSRIWSHPSQFFHFDWLEIGLVCYNTLTYY